MKTLYTAIAIVALAVSGITQAQNAPEQSMDKPWDYNFDNAGQTPYDDDQSEQGKRLKARWQSCSGMVLQTNMVAKTIADVNDNPDDYYVTAEQNRKQLDKFFPTNTGTYQDTINEKILELGDKHWKMTRGEEDNSPELSQMAWDWCTNQDAENFVDL